MALFVGNQQKAIFLIKNNFTPLTQMVTLHFLLSTFPFFFYVHNQNLLLKKAFFPKPAKPRHWGSLQLKNRSKRALVKKNKLKRTLKKKKPFSVLAKALSKRHECSYSQTRRQKPLGYSKSLEPKALMGIQSNMKAKTSYLQ